MTVARTKRRSQAGKKQAAKSKTAKARTPSLEGFYRYKLPAVESGGFTFHLELLRPHDAALSLDRMVDTLSWDDEQSVLSGSLTAYRPDPADPTSFPVTRGQLVRCSVEWGGGRSVLWTMRTKAPVAQVDTGNVQVDLEDDMALLDGGNRDWWYRKTKRRPFGYTADEVTREVAKALGVKVRALARGTTRFEIKMKGVTGLAVIQQAYQNEKAKSGRQFVIRLRNGQLEVVPLQRNPTLYTLGQKIRTAQITQKAGSKIPTTVLTGKGRIGKGKATKAVSYTEYDRRVVRLLGYVHDTQDFGRVSSHADLRGQVKRELAKRLQLNDAITIEHGGIPFVQRGDGVFVDLPKEGYSHGQSYVYCTRAVHTVQAGVYTMSCDFNASDPYAGVIPGSSGSAKAKRAAKRKVRPRPKVKRKK